MRVVAVANEKGGVGKTTIAFHAAHKLAETHRVLVIDLDQRRVTRAAAEVRLSRTEWELLTELATNPGKVLLHGELLTRIWGSEFRDESQYLRTWVSRLRAKLGDDALITTFPGLGYRLEPPTAMPT